MFCTLPRSSSGATERLDVRGVDGRAFALSEEQERLIWSLKEMQAATRGIVQQVQESPRRRGVFRSLRSVNYRYVITCFYPAELYESGLLASVVRDSQGGKRLKKSEYG